MRRLRALCAAAALALALTACTGRQSIEELLRAPQANEAQSAVQSALTSYLGEPLQLKYPRGGSEMAPLLFCDLDGDGQDEAAALYVTEAKGTDVHLAILENRDDGWEVTYEIAGLGSEVAGIEEANILDSGVQLIVGYANTTLTDKYLAVYSYRGDSVTQLYTGAYTSYIAEDLLPGGGTELVVVLPVTQTSVDIAVLAASDGGVGVCQTLSLSENFVSCDGLYVTRSGGKTGLVADGASSNEGRVTELFLVHSDYLVRSGVDAAQLTQRAVSGLDPTDFDGLGTVELPTAITAVNTLNFARRFYFVTWQDLLNGLWTPEEMEQALEEQALEEPQTPESGGEEPDADVSVPQEPENADSVSPEPESGEASSAESAEPESAEPESGLPDGEPQGEAEDGPGPDEPLSLAELDAGALEADGVRFGVYDATNGYFLRLPLAWRDQVMLADGALQGDWLVRDAQTNEILVSVRIVGRDESISSDSYSFVGMTEEKKIYVAVPSRVDEGAAGIVSTGFSVMQ